MAKRTPRKAIRPHTAPRGTQPRGGARGPLRGDPPRLGKADTSVLAKYDPTDSAGAHPDWVKSKFAPYIAAGGSHEMTSVREFSHAGHHIKVITTYRVEVDGEPVHLHLSVDEDGRVHTHATPFVTYGSALDLMKAVLDAYPDSFDDRGGGGGQGGHDGGDHGHHGHGGPHR